MVQDYGVDQVDIQKWGESFAECAKRETFEEAGIEIDNVRLLCLSNLFLPDNKHYVDIGVIADWASGEPRVCEPEKNAGWEWFAFSDIPPAEELFACEQFYVDTYLSGTYPVFNDSKQYRS